MAVAMATADGVMSELRGGTMWDQAAASSFDEFFRSSSRRLFAQAFVLTGSRELAQDLTQEAFARAWARWRKIERLDDPESWTRRVLHNLCIDAWRRSTRQPPATTSELPS